MAFSIRNVEKFLDSCIELRHRREEIMENARRLVGGQLTMSDVAATMLFGRRLAGHFNRVVTADSEHLSILLEDMAKDARRG